MAGLELRETSHPNKDALSRHERLIGIEQQKAQLLEELILLIEPTRLDKWQKKHHPRGLPIASALSVASPLILLSGDVGCGKTELSTTIGSPLASALDRKVITLETPSDIRGHGLVGELSTRITEAFSQARTKVAQSNKAGLLIIDEADDLATTRDQTEAHHEDRAGVNVLIKEIDEIARKKAPLAVLMITNRASALDAAVVRRAALHLQFERPDKRQRRAAFEKLFQGMKSTREEIDDLVRATEPQRGVPYSYSDLLVRIAKAALRRAWRSDRPFGPDILLEVIHETSPTPLLASHSVEKERSRV